MTEQPTPEGMIKQLQEMAARLGVRSISRSEYKRQGGATEWWIIQHFDSWNAFVTASGLEPTDVSRVDDDDLWQAMLEAFEAAGGVLTRTRFRKEARYSADVYTKRWGRWQNVLRNFCAWAHDNAPDFAFLDDLPDRNEAMTAATVTTSPATTSPSWKPMQTTQLGPFLNFRGLQHAPINEQGVVFLFGMVAVDLGYVVEGVGTGFPDCEAKRCVSPAGDKWERVRIEFEYRSRNFRDHGHDPAGCDLLVCWEHNWADCPVEVLELQSAVAELSE